MSKKQLKPYLTQKKKIWFKSSDKVLLKKTSSFSSNKRWVPRKKRPYHLAFFYKRPWWWRAKLGIWWIQRNKYFLKWKKYKKWYQLIRFLNFQKPDQSKNFKLKFTYKYNLLIRSVIRKVYGNLSHTFLKKQVSSIKNKKTFLDARLVSLLENRLDVFVSRFTWIRNLSQSQELIKRGFIAVNGKTIHSKGFQLKETDVVSINDFYLKFVKHCFKSLKRGFPQTQTRHKSNKILSEGLVNNPTQKDIFFFKFLKQNIFKTLFKT